MLKSPNQIEREQQEATHKNRIKRLLETREKAKQIELEKQQRKREIETKEFHCFLQRKMEEFHLKKQEKLDVLYFTQSKINENHALQTKELREIQLKNDEILDFLVNSILENQEKEAKRFKISLELQKREKNQHEIKTILKRELLKQVHQIEKLRSKYIALLPKREDYEVKRALVIDNHEAQAVKVTRIDQRKENIQQIQLETYQRHHQKHLQKIKNHHTKASRYNDAMEKVQVERESKLLELEMIQFKEMDKERKIKNIKSGRNASANLNKIFIEKFQIK